MADESLEVRMDPDGVWGSWTFENDKPGPFDVVAEIATFATGSKFEILLGSETLAAQAPNTGSYQTFETVTTTARATR